MITAAFGLVCFIAGYALSVWLNRAQAGKSLTPAQAWGQIYPEFFKKP